MGNCTCCNAAQPEDNNRDDFVKSVATGAMAGATFGSVIGPIGSAGGAAIGGASALVSKWINDRPS